jgi:hypothetical protein
MSFSYRKFLKTKELAKITTSLWEIKKNIFTPKIEVLFENAKYNKIKTKEKFIWGYFAYQKIVYIYDKPIFVINIIPNTGKLIGEFSIFVETEPSNEYMSKTVLDEYSLGAPLSKIKNPARISYSNHLTEDLNNEVWKYMLPRIYSFHNYVEDAICEQYEKEKGKSNCLNTTLSSILIQPNLCWSLLEKTNKLKDHIIIPEKQKEIFVLEDKPFTGFTKIDFNKKKE